jgi:hypothetical protein
MRSSPAASSPAASSPAASSPAAPSLEVGDILFVDTECCYVLDKKDQVVLLPPHNDAKAVSIDYIGRSVRCLLDKGFDKKMVVEVASLLNCFTDCFKAEEHMRKLMSIVQHNEHQVAVEYITSVWSQLSRSTTAAARKPNNILSSRAI